jgi:hypothetical protein
MGGRLGDRFFQATAVLATFLLLATVFLGIFVVVTWAPTWFAEKPGGSLSVSVFPRCGSFFADFGDRPCFERANATVMYSDGRSVAVSLHELRDEFSGRIELDEARATLRVQTERGTWVREVLVLQDTQQAIRITGGSPRTDNTLHGHEPGLAYLFLPFGLIALGLVLTSGTWLIRGSVGAANLTRVLLILSLLAVGVVFLVAFYLTIINLFFAGWIALLLYWTSRWIRGSEPQNLAAIEDEVAAVLEAEGEA